MKRKKNADSLGATADMERASEPVVGETNDSQGETLADLRGAVLLPVGMIRRWRGQPRAWFDEEKLQELAESIRLRGVLQPIRVRPDRRLHLAPGGYVITMGERRFLAAQLAGLAEVPAIIHDVDETQALFDALAENLQRQDLTPDEENEAVRRLRDRGLQDSEIARRLGVSKSTISRLVAVFDDPILGPQVSNGRLTLTQARELLNLPESERVRLADFLALRQEFGTPVGRAELRHLVADAHQQRPVVPVASPSQSRGADASAPPPETSGGLISGHLRVVVDQEHLTPTSVDPQAPLPMVSPPSRSLPAEPVEAPALVAAEEDADEEHALRDSRLDRERSRAIARARELHNFVTTMLTILDRHADDPAIHDSLVETHTLLGQALGDRD